MQNSRSQTTKLSDNASFSVAGGSADNKKQISFFYKDSGKTHGDNLMLVLFPENLLPKYPVEIPMFYDAVNKRYETSIVISKDVGEMFLITTAKIPGKKGNEKESVLQQGFVSLKNGIQQPVNKMPGVPQGKLETCLLTKDGQIQKPISTDGFSHVSVAKNKPALKDIQPDTLVVLLEDQMLTVYWVENGKVINKSFPERLVHEIAKILPSEDSSSNDKKLIEAITLQYGCTAINVKTLAEGERFIQVYIPPGYNPNRMPPYNLQINLDGGQYLFPMQMNILLDNLIAANEIEPVIAVFISPHSGPPNDNCEGFGVVMPKGYPLSMRFKEYSCNWEFADKLAAIPNALREHFNVTNDSKHTTIWGVSKGGLQSVYTALLHPDVFGKVVAESPEAWNIPVQNGKDWRTGIIDIKRNGADCSWETSTATLPAKEGQHNEHLTQIIRSGQDSISGRKLDSSKPLVFYFDAGEREKEYKPEVGSANLVNATMVLADAAMQKGHTVIDQGVHVITGGGHHNMTWMRNLAHAERSIHSPAQTLTISSNAKLFQSLGIKSSSQETHAQDKNKKITTTDDISYQPAKMKQTARVFRPDIKRTASDDTGVKYSDKPSTPRKK